MTEIRGGLPHSLDARLLERAARSACARYRSIVAAGTDPGKVAAVNGEHPGVKRRLSISPFARDIGLAFEHRLMKEGAALLKKLYAEPPAWSDVVPWMPNEVCDLRLLLRDSADDAERKTMEAIEGRLGGGEGPDVLLGARLSLETPSGTVHIKPDYLVWWPTTGGKVRVGEVKSYLDLDGRTDASEIGTAVRQAAVGVTAIRRLFGGDACGSKVDLALRAPNSSGASIRTLDASAEIANLRSFLSTLPRELDAMTRVFGGHTLEAPGVIEQVPHRFEASCEGHCAFYEHCHEEANRNDELALLGPSAASALEGVASVARAVELAQGKEPATEDEERVAPALNMAWRASEMAEAQLREPSPG